MFIVMSYICIIYVKYASYFLLCPEENKLNVQYFLLSVKLARMCSTHQHSGVKQKYYLTKFFFFYFFLWGELFAFNQTKQLGLNWKP